MSTVTQPEEKQAAVKQAARAARNLPLALMLLVSGVYLLTMSGHTYSPDEETMLTAAQSLIVNGSWALPPSRALVEVTGADGQRYSQYGPGQSAAAVPWVLVGRAVGTVFPKDQAGFPLRLVLASYNALIAAGICGLFAAAGLALGYSTGTSLLTAAMLAFGTFLWPHSRTFFSEPLAALGLFAAFYLLLISPRLMGRWTWLAPTLSGVLFALAAATKVQYAVALPAFLVYLAWVSLAARRRGVSHPIPQSQIRNRQSAGLRPLIAWIVGLFLGLVPLFAYNLAVFGSAFTTGYGADLKGTFKTPLLEGVSGLLVSPGKGLLWYALPLVLAAWGLVSFARRHKAEAVFIGLLFVSIVAFFGMYIFWPGDGSWGPRYLIPLLPFVLLPALPAVQSSLDSRLRAGFNPRLLVVSAVFGLGLIINLLGVLANFDTYINVINEDATRYWRPEASPILGHARLLGQRVDEWVTRLHPPPGTVLFRSGFSYSEGDKSKGELLPRWTTGQAVLDISPEGNQPMQVTLRLADHRPPELPRAQVSVLAGGSTAQVSTSPVEGHPESTDYKFSLPANSGTVTIQSDTWNPSTLQKGGRDEDLGVMLEQIAITQGGSAQQYKLVEALPAPPYYPQPRWYYDPGTHHPTDLWETYILETGMGRKAALALALPVLLAGLACIVWGWRGIRGRGSGVGGQ